MTLAVEQAALMMTIQDAGRFGYRRFGMPESGPIDWWAHRCANQLVGNPTNAACIEAGYSAASMIASADSLLAVCGAGYSIAVNQRQIPLWMSFWVKRGDRITIRKELGGQWVYLAVQGGFQTHQWMSSCSVNLRAGLGCQIKDGDSIKIDGRISQARATAGRVIPNELRPAYKADPIIRVVPGPHQNRFTIGSIEDFYSKTYSLTLNSDRMGYRLSGPKITHTHGADLISQGMVMGEIQVPRDGQPIVMMPDHPTSGGYTCIATAAKIDQPLLAQAEPEKSKIQFMQMDVKKGQQAFRDIICQLDSLIFQEEEAWLQY